MYLIILEDKGLVHNDIKGDNILVKTKENDEHEYRVTDFGCAHLIPGSEAESAFSDIWQELKRELTQNNEINREKLENIKLDDIIPSYDPIDPDDISDYSDFESETESNQSSKRI
ncbi:hypothetical protein [Agarilytica rhodophyticola]|uniref:hypothetical protein n=1 Tax=Agarilytica rhodophyticola TaxID=1737490 RepID=UPI000B3471A0|nr:hypothetical protein [Agarilytica rhodophyticola]